MSRIIVQRHCRGATLVTYTGMSYSNIGTFQKKYEKDEGPLGTNGSYAGSSTM